MTYRRTIITLTAALACSCVAPAVESANAENPRTETASSVSQWGITWHFEEPASVGQFANGDHWVVGPVTITRITPDFDGEENGWEVNPTFPGPQGFSARMSHFDARLVPDLPYSAQPGESIVKVIHGKDAADNTLNTALETAAVLTVVDAPPPDNGRNTFRPPYVAGDKPLYTVDQLRTDLLPAWPHVSRAHDAITLDWVERQFQRVQLDHKGGSLGREIHPFRNIPDYGADVGRRNGDGVLRLMLDDPLDNKMPGLIAYVQYGIDLYHMYLDGHRWPAGGGQRPGQKIVLAFASVMLDDQQMQHEVTSMTEQQFLNEDFYVYFSPHANDGQGQVLFGTAGTEQRYWETLDQVGVHHSLRDPYGYIDGGVPPDGYQVCCLSQPWKGQVLAVHLMPELRPVWNNELMIQYVERWVTVGVWTQPDPIARQVPDTFHGRGVPGDGRFPDAHATMSDAGHYGSPFQNQLWDAHRDTSRASD
ncbi:MAG: hypothetical protein WD009_13475 [Phycisphaeraceae bacterium]